MTALERLTASEGARLIATGRITAESLVRARLDRIEAREPIVRAWTFLDPDAAIRQARQRDRTTPTGPLHGVPIVEPPDAAGDTEPAWKAVPRGTTGREEASRDD